MVSVVTVARRLWLTYFFFVAILLINVALFGAMLLQTVGLLSERDYRRFANWCTGSTWCFYPLCFEDEAEGRVVVYGQTPPRDSERVLVMANHIAAPDW